MLLQMKKLGLDKDRKDSDVLNFSFVVSICCHICLFSIFFIKLPNNIEKTVGINSLNFIGSFLNKYDFYSGENNLTQHQNSKYLNFAKQNAFALEVKDYAKLDNLLDKPGTSLLINDAPEEYAFPVDARVLELSSSKKYSLPSENIFFDVKNLPNMQIYFKEGLPGSVKFDLYISQRGRVSFLKKAITSGSFDADMAVQRALIRTVFDTYHFGVLHRRTVELDLKQ